MPFRTKLRGINTANVNFCVADVSKGDEFEHYINEK